MLLHRCTKLVLPVSLLKHLCFPSNRIHEYLTGGPNLIILFGKCVMKCCFGRIAQLGNSLANAFKWEFIISSKHTIIPIEIIGDSKMLTIDKSSMTNSKYLLSFTLSRHKTKGKILIKTSIWLADCRSLVIV